MNVTLRIGLTTCRIPHGKSREIALSPVASTSTRARSHRGRVVSGSGRMCAFRLLGWGVACVIFAGLHVVNGQETSPKPGLLQPPGPDKFAVQPTTPKELWDAVDYLVRSGQAKLAVPYLEAFVNAEPDDATLVALRDRYGLGSFLRLSDDESTRALGAQVLDRLKTAARKFATDPEAIQAAIALLTKGPAEQVVAVERLREAGPHAIPPLMEALASPGTTPAERASLVANMGKLDSRAVPPLIAALDSENPGQASDAAEALGRIGDRRALGPLVALAAQPTVPEGTRMTAQHAVERLTGRSFSALGKSPLRYLVDQAWLYAKGRVRFPADQVEIWNWSNGNLEFETVDREEASTRLGERLARAALAIDAADVDAQKVLISLLLGQAARRHGCDAVVQSDPDGSFAVALSAGPAVLADLLRNATKDGEFALAELLAHALGRVTNRDTLSEAGRNGAGRHPLVEAMNAPDRRTQFAAAQALTELDPRRPFPGSSQVLTTLARFLGGRELPRALIIDGNATRSGTTVAVLRALGYDTATATSAVEGFQQAAAEADTEVIFLEPTALQGKWGWLETLANLRSDARTSSTPVIVHGPQSLEDQIGAKVESFPRTAFLVSPTEPAGYGTILKRTLNRLGVRGLSESERKDLAAAAARLIARIAAQPGSPFGADLARIEPELSLAVTNPAARRGAIEALGDVPGVNPQRRLADVVLDPGMSAEERRLAGAQLVRSIQRFGPLLTSRQEQLLVDALAAEPDASMRSLYAAVVGTLRPAPAAAGSRLRDFRATRAPGEAEPRRTDDQP